MILYSITVSIINVITIGNYMTLVLGVLLLGVDRFWKRLPNNKFIKAIKAIVWGGVIAVFLIIAFIFVFSAVSKTEFDDDAVIVLGCGLRGSDVSLTLKKRLDRCIEYSQKNQDAVIIVSGGQGPNEDVSEAFAMSEYLIQNGIDREKIIQEDKSTSTYENFKYSKKILDPLLGEDYKICYITNRFHSYRASRIAEINGLRAKGYNSPDEIFTAPVAYMREVLAVIKLWIFKR